MDQIPIHFVLSLPLIGAFAMLALGIVVIFRASSVLNLAHGAMAMVPPFVLFELSEAGIPLVPALILAVASGALLGAGIERVFVRGLRRQGGTGQTVGTVATLSLLVAAAVKIWGTTPRSAVSVFPDGGIPIGASELSYGQMGLMAVSILTTVALFALFSFTNLGLAMRIAADNRRAAALMGVNPDFTTRVAWALGGGLAALAGILLASVTTLHPINLSLLVLPAFVAALIGGLGSLVGALVGATIVGLAQGMVPSFGLIPGLGTFATQVGAPQLVLTMVAFVVMGFRGARFVGSDVRAEADQAPTAPSDADDDEHSEREEEDSVDLSALRGVGRVVGRIALVVLLLGWPFQTWIDLPSSYMQDAIDACVILLVAASLVLLTGWVGQISLAQASFVGLGAFFTAMLARNWGIEFPLSLPLAGLVAAIAAAMLGFVALRVRGLYLAVATLIFLWMSSEYLFSQSWLVGAGGSAFIDPQSVGTPDAIPFFDFTNRRTFYFVGLAVAAGALWALANLRDSKTGRAFFAVRGSETAAASLGIDVTRYKLLAFALSGALAGIAGNLIMVNRGAVVPSEFGFTVSLFYLAVAVVGGLTSLGGAVAAAILFAALNELFFNVSALAGWLEIVSAGLLAVVLLLRPGGLASLPDALRPLVRRGLRPLQPLATKLARPLDRVARTLGRAGTRVQGVTRVVNRGLAVLRHRISTRPSGDDNDRVDGEQNEAPSEEPAKDRSGTRGPRQLAKQRSKRTPVLEVESVTVQFGGLKAADNVSLKVCEGEIVGLIGPNGAGKTTTFNSISGLNVPTAGTVHLFDRDVTNLAVHERARLGLARTFQVIQLFPQLTVYDNLLVATHLENPSTVVGNIAVTAPSLLSEHRARERVDDVVGFLDLGEVANRQVAGLPFGILRMVEVARALVTGAPLIMFDEAASGLDSAETENLIRLLRYIRDERGVSMLLIEHDIAMVTSISDYIYVLNRGQLIAEGTPSEIQRDEAVIAAYLGRPAESDIAPPGGPAPAAPDDDPVDELAEVSA